MDAAIRQLRATARRLARGKHPNAVRYPRAVRDAVVALARTRIGHGQTMAQVARDIGLSLPTLAAWLERPRRRALRPVAVMAELEAEPARSSVVLVTPQGFRVEGLGDAALVAILRALQ